MSNPYYTRLFNPSPLTFARSGEVRAEYERVQQGFDGIDAALAPSLTEVSAARQGQVSLLDNLQRFVTTFAPATGNADLGGFAINNLAAPSALADAATKGYVDALVITAAAPQWLPTTTAVNKTLVPFESCTVTAPGVEIQLPAAPTYGVTKVRIRVAEGMSARVMRNGLSIQGDNEDMDMTSGQWVELQAESATEGWVIA